MKEESVVHLFSTVQDGLANIQKKLDDVHKMCMSRQVTCAKHIESKTSNSLFRWVIGILVLTLLSIGGITTSTRIKTAEVSIAVENMKTDMVDMNEKIGKIEKVLSHRIGVGK